MSTPPFADLTGYATRLTQLVSDTKGGFADKDFVSDALERYCEDYPCEVTTDIGDGTTKEWDLSATPFTKFDRGQSDQWPVQVERLDGSSLPLSPQEWFQPGTDFWIDAREVSGVPKLYLVFRSAPPTTKWRVRWRRRWRVSDAVVSPAAAAVNEVPTHHQNAVVYLAAEIKCLSLASFYAGTVDNVGGSDLFEGKSTAQLFRTMAKDWRARYETILGIGRRAGITVGVVDDGNLRVWPRWSSNGAG